MSGLCVIGLSIGEANDYFRFDPTRDPTVPGSSMGDEP